MFEADPPLQHWARRLYLAYRPRRLSCRQLCRFQTLGHRFPQNPLLYVTIVYDAVIYIIAARQIKYFLCRVLTPLFWRECFIVRHLNCQSAR